VRLGAEDAASWRRCALAASSRPLETLGGGELGRGSCREELGVVVELGLLGGGFGGRGDLRRVAMWRKRGGQGRPVGGVGAGVRSWASGAREAVRGGACVCCERRKASWAGTRPGGRRKAGERGSRRPGRARVLELGRVGWGASSWWQGRWS
jgi:hypothetical protein